MAEVMAGDVRLTIWERATTASAWIAQDGRVVIRDLIPGLQALLNLLYETATRQGAGYGQK